jgi:glycosyltransferase involved in cell wall biosynthesis
MPTYNGERFITEALEGLLSQTFADFELIISDNASTDSTPAICRAYAARDPRIRYIVQPRNLGVFDNHEFVVREALGEYFMFAGDDDVHAPSYVETMVKLLDESNEIALAYSDFGYISEAGVRGQPVGLRIVCDAAHSRLFNIARFMLYKSCLPMVMGMFRTKILLGALPMPHRQLRPMSADVDNALLVKVLTRGKARGTRSCLFYYRLKDRSSSFPPNWPAARSQQFLYLMAHNARVVRLMNNFVAESDLSLAHKLPLQAWAWISYTILLALPQFKSLWHNLRAALPTAKR